ncbi:MAG: hypothetical protein ABEI53_02625 [Candidatus Magasanikbacteria bacterium]
MSKIGEVTHFFGDINVAVVDLEDSLEIGDEVSFERNGEELFSQRVDSMEVDHEKVESADSGDEVAIKVKKKAKEGTEVHTA